MSKPSVAPPQIRKQFHFITQHGETRIDPYHWLRGENPDDWKEVMKDPSLLNAEVREVLEGENAHTQAYLDTFQDITDAVGHELMGRIIPTESSVPVTDGDWEYWAAYHEGANYPVYMRRHVTSGDEQVVFDTNKESEGHAFFNVSGVGHSPDQKLTLISIDNKGSEYFTITFRDIETGEELPDKIERSNGNAVWSPDSKSIYYVECDDEHKPTRLKYHVLGTDPQNDLLLHEETRDGIGISVSKTLSGEYIFVTNSGQDASEVRFIKADQSPETTPLTLIKPREEDVEYSVRHHGDHFYILTNADGAREFKIMRTPVDAFTQENWEEFLPYDEKITQQGLTLLKDYMVRNERFEGQSRIVIADFDGNEYTVDVPDEAYDIGASAGYEFDTDKIRITYDTPVYPGETYELNMKTKEKKILKQRILPNGHDPDEYIVERKFVTARDNEQIPVTILRHKSTPVDGTAPLHQYGYGSYGMSMDNAFASSPISLVDRGVIYAVAHIRGGGEMGEKWHFAGKEETKMNTFTDFIDVTEALTEQGYGEKGKVVMEGGSAGGMLMGAVANMRPDLYSAVIAGVPFVDVLNTISDETLPLTPGEWREWGNPIEDPVAYAQMKSYSPYDNIQQDVEYPTVFAFAGLTDYRVTYWEPAKWIARLREETKGGPFYLRMEMDSGHSGASSRYQAAKERGLRYAFSINRFRELGYDVSMRVDYDAKNQEKKVDKEQNLSAPTAANSNPQPSVTQDQEPPAVNM
jgi:oligopeptidase B